MCGWDAAKTAGQPRALGDVGPTLLSGCYLQPEPRLLLKNYYPDTCVFSKVKQNVA